MKHVFIGCLLGVSLASGLGNAIGKEADCSVARDPRRCEAQQAAKAACGDLQGQAKSACLHEAMPLPDCTRAPNTVECQAKLSAAQACKGKHGKSHHKCLQDKQGKRSGD